MQSRRIPLKKRRRGFSTAFKRKMRKGRQGQSVMTTTNKRQIANFFGLERKFYDTSLAGQAVVNSTSGAEVDPTTINSISVPQQGDGESQRDGRRFTINSASIRGVIDEQANTTAQYQVLVALVLDTQTNGAQLNSEDVYVNPSGNTLGNCALHRNLKFVQRFKVLQTRLITMTPSGVGGDGTTVDYTFPQQPFSIFHSFKNGLQCTASTINEGVANVTDNSLHVLAFTNGGSSPEITYNSRVKFMG